MNIFYSRYVKLAKQKYSKKELAKQDDMSSTNIHIAYLKIETL